MGQPQAMPEGNEGRLPSLPPWPGDALWGQLSGLQEARKPTAAAATPHELAGQDCLGGVVLSWKDQVCSLGVLDHTQCEAALGDITETLAHTKFRCT